MEKRCSCSIASTAASPPTSRPAAREEIEEERRLLYVAMTRAREELELIVPRRFYVHGQPRNGDRHVLAARTRFLPAALLRHFAQTTWPPVAAAPRAPRRARGRASI